MWQAISLVSVCSSVFHWSAPKLVHACFCTQLGMALPAGIHLCSPPTPVNHTTFRSIPAALFVTLDDTFFFTDWVTSTATPAIPTMAEYFWSDPEAALNVSACASACATAYESCGFFRLALAETVIGSCKLYPLETNASIVVHARTDPSPGRELVHWGYGKLSEGGRGSVGLPRMLAAG